jgi:hypothetical protein
MIDADRLIAECQHIAIASAPPAGAGASTIEHAEAVSAAPTPCGCVPHCGCVRLALAVHDRSMFFDLAPLTAKILAAKLSPELLLRRPTVPSNN